MGFFWPNHIKFQLKKVQKSYLSWYWRLTQILKKNWHVASNMTWGIWWIFTQSLKSPKIPLQWAIFVQSIWGLGYKNREKLSLMTLNSDAKFGNSDLVVSKMAWGIGWTFIRHSKIWKILLWSLFLPKAKNFSARKFIGIMCHDNEDWCKILMKTESWLEKWHRKFG